MTTRGIVLAAFLAALCAPAPAVASAPATETAYITTHNVGVLPLDVFSNMIGPPIPIPGSTMSGGIAITPDGSTAYATSAWQSQLVPIETATDTAGAPITALSFAGAIAITPDGTTAYVTTAGGVQTVDLATGTASAQLKGVNAATDLAITPDGTTVYATSFGAITAIDTATGTVRATIPLAGDVWGVAISADGATGYAANTGTNTVIVFDVATNTVVTTIPTSAVPATLAITPDGTSVYVASLNTSAVDAIDTQTNNVVATIPAGISPWGIAVTPDSSTAYVTSRDSVTVTAIDTATNKATATLPAPSMGLYDIAITPAQAPAAAFTTTPGAQRDVSFDASATTVADSTVATYAWDFGDGQTETTTSPTTSHAYADDGTYTVTLTATSAAGCSTELVFTGSTASCNGSADARVEHDVTVATPVAPPVEPIEPAAPQAPEVAAAAPLVERPARKPRVAKQSIERFTIDARCVRPSRTGTARIGLNVRLARPGAVAVQVDRATDAVALDRCPKPNPKARYRGGMRDLKRMKGMKPRTASVDRKLALDLRLAPGLYRIGIRAHTEDGHTRPAYRWVRVLAPHDR